MTLFWHNHFATGYTKIAGALGATEGARYLAAKASEDPGQVRGQIEMLRDNALGNFKDILLAIAKDPAMLVWLDGRTNTKAKPQENFGREIMELFTVGVGNYTEPDVYAAARVFTGWNLQRPRHRGRRLAALRVRLQRRPARDDRQDVQLRDLSGRRQDDPGALGGRRACRTASTSSTASPRTRTRRATWRPSCIASSSASSARVNVTFVNRVASVYLQSGGDMKAVMREVLLSPRVLGRRRLLRALLVAGGVRRPRAQGHRLDRLLGQRRADAAVEHGADPVRAAGRRRLGRRARPGSRPARCWRA